MVVSSTITGADGKITQVSKIENAGEHLKFFFHESYQKKELFGNLTGSLKLDLYALLVIGFVFFVGLYVALKSKDPIKISR